MIINLQTSLEYNKYKSKSVVYSKELNESIKSFIPGQWCNLLFKNGEKKIAIINNQVIQGPVIRFINCFESYQNEIDFISALIKIAINKRNMLYPNSCSRRLIYGDSDNMPGVIVDQFENCILLQINSAGFDLYRDFIKEELSSLLNSDVYFYDNQNYRKNEGLPNFKIPKIPDNIKVIENKISYIIPSENIQKIGYYFDHRENREKLKNKLGQYDTSNIQNALDLFCYSGSWGLNALSVLNKDVTMEFVDQGDFCELINSSIKENGYLSKYSFTRSDVFKFLDHTKTKYQLIISDPPAFSKRIENRKQALVGYRKLINKVLNVTDKKCFWALGSCTHGISFEDLDGIVNEVKVKYNRKVQMLDIGIQGGDHPFSSLRDNNFYIKYILYYVEEI